MRVAVVGAGHVGLVTGAALAGIGHEVVCMDVSKERVDALAGGIAPFREPGLDDLLARGLDERSLRFTTDMAEAVDGTAVVFICVGRPPVDGGDRSVTAVEGAVRGIATHASDGVVIVVKSTVPPGTTDRIARLMSLERPELSFSAASSPEFLREGHAIEDTLRPERIVVGVEDALTVEVLRELYAPILEDGVQLIVTDPRTAELSKLASNAFLATKISFANGLAHLSELAGADVAGVTEIMGADPRIGRAFLGAGLGYGGYCLPKDIATLGSVAERLGFDFGLLREVQQLNADALTDVRRKIEEAVWNLEGKTVALLGLAFKAGTDDVRSAPALTLAAWLLEEGAHVVGHDPMASERALEVEPRLAIASSPYEAATAAHCLVVCTEWPEYKDLDFSRLRQEMATPAIVDGRNLLDPDAVAAAGFLYFPMGRPARDAVPTRGLGV